MNGASKYQPEAQTCGCFFCARRPHVCHMYTSQVSRLAFNEPDDRQGARYNHFVDGSCSQCGKIEGAVTMPRRVAEGRWVSAPQCRPEALGWVRGPCCQLWGGATGRLGQELWPDAPPVGAEDDRRPPTHAQLGAQAGTRDRCPRSSDGVADAGRFVDERADAAHRAIRELRELLWEAGSARGWGR